MRIKKYGIGLLSITLLVSLISGQSLAKDGLKISDAWIPQAPPVAKVMAGYLKINNPTSSKITINKVTSPNFNTVEMHQTIEKDGMARMVKQETMTIPANSEVIFKRGGLHLMLIQPKQPLNKGEKISLSFSTNKGKVDVTAEVKAAELDDHSHHHHHH